MHQEKPRDPGLQALAELRKSPLVSWPALAILVVYYGVYITLWKLSLDGNLNNGVGVAIAAFIAYLAFTPSHDCMHRAFSRVGWINELALRFSTFVAVPFGSGKLFRVMHMQRYGHDSSKKQPHPT